MKTLSFLFAAMGSLASAAPPVVSNIRVSQRPGTKLVDVYYDVTDADGGAQAIDMQVSGDAGLTYSIPSPTVSGDIGAGVSLGANKHIVWNAGADWGGNFVPQAKVRVTAYDGTTPPAPPGMALIPGGPFQMGDNLDGMSDAPVHNVQVDAFFMDKYLVTGTLWSQVQGWGTSNGYSISGGSWKALNHPVQTISWYDMVKWCNARSQMEGLTPCYYTDATQTVIDKSGKADIQNTWVKWTANGYRLPTEAEWEKAARGGRMGNRYPWGDTISGSNANYNVIGNPWQVGNQPWTSPVGSYAPNNYGLYDVAGDLWQWCWDWYGNYYGTPGSDNNPLGPVSGSNRVRRGGSGENNSSSLRVAFRIYNGSPGISDTSIGFRSIRR